jgi:hypothetical protein
LVVQFGFQADREPLFEELTDRGPRRDAGASAGDLDHRSEFAFCFGTVAANCRGAVAASTSYRVTAGEDAQLERADAALTNRSIHERSIGNKQPELMGK